MSRHPSFKPPGGLSKKRNVLKRFERVELLKKRGQWKEGDRVTGVQVRDSENGAVTDVRGHVVVNATGVWTDEIQALSKQRGRFRVRASKGVHVVVPRDRIVSEVAIILRTEKSVLFVIPWGTHWIIGTTDTDWNLDLAHPAATKADIDYILGHVNTVLATPLTHDDIDGVYAGLRPLLAGESEETSKLSREHAVAVPAPGLVAIAGGKYTTYRVMAEDAIDAAAEFVPTRVARSITEKVPLVGADGYFALVNQTQRVGSFYGLHPYRVRHLLDRYGSLISEVLAMAEDRPELLEPITEAPVYLKVEAAYAAAAKTALGLLRTRPGLAKRLQRNTVFVKDTLRESGLAINASVFPVVSLNCPSPKEATVLRRRLLANGIYPSCIRYPSDKADAFYRFAISSEHTRAQLEKLAEALCP